MQCKKFFKESSKPQIVFSRSIAMEDKLDVIQDNTTVLHEVNEVKVLTQSSRSAAGFIGRLMTSDAPYNQTQLLLNRAAGPYFTMIDFPVSPVKNYQFGH